MQIKTWVAVGIVYLALVIGAYGFISGENIFQSGTMHVEHNEEQNKNHNEEHEEESDMDHSGHNHHGEHGAEESQVMTHVMHQGDQLMIHLEDDEDNAPELEISHEKEMHVIAVSNDLEQYLHLHPEKQGEGMYVINQTLADGEYQVFIDISPKGKAYTPTANPLQIGEVTTPKTELNQGDSWTNEIDGKTVTLESVQATVNETVPLVFDYMAKPLSRT